MTEREALIKRLRTETWSGFQSMAAQAADMLEADAQRQAVDERSIKCYQAQVEDMRAQHEPMNEVADRYAHRLALELECVLADRAGYYDKALEVLSGYRAAMNAIHEQHSPTHMGEPLLHAEVRPNAELCGGTSATNV